MQLGEGVLFGSWRPPLFVWRGHAAECPKMFDFPHPVDFDIIVLVSGSEPKRAVALAEGERTKEIPYPMRLAALHLDARIKDIVL